MNKIVVYSGTKNVYKKMLPAVNSLLQHCNVDKIYFLIEDDKFPYELPQKVTCINVKNQNWFSPQGPNYARKWSYMVLLRAAYTKLFPDIDIILSLDIDTIVNENIDDIWDIPLDDYYLAAVPETHRHNYINMGVALMNLKKLREDKKDDELIEKLNTIPYLFNEQDCINECCDKIYHLSPDYNVCDYTDYDKAAHRKITHFAAIKDWYELPEVQEYSDKFFVHDLPFGLDIIIPSYNNEEGLHRTLDSIHYPELSNWVHITIVDDCSTTIDYKSITKDYPLANVISCSENGGPAAARNIGVSLTHHSHILFLDCGDTIFSKYCFYEIKDVLLNNTMLDIYQWCWLNGETKKVSSEFGWCLHGTVFKRRFLERYNITFNEDKEGAYSNEDVGFMYTCFGAIFNIKTYDQSPHYKFFDMPIHHYYYDENSLTHINDKEFIIKKHIPGLVSNAIYSVRTCEKNNFDIEVLLRIINIYMVGFYRNYLELQNNRRAQPYLQMYWEKIRNFYLSCYKKYENHPKNSFYINFIMGPQMKSMMTLTKNRINLRRFLHTLDENSENPMVDF